MNIHTNPPLIAGQAYTVDIHDIGGGGEGVGRCEGMTVFVPGALPGETVRVVMTAVKKKYAVGAIETVLTSAPARVTPPADYHADCGVYPLLIWDYAAQLDWKRRRVEELLRRIGGIETQVRPVLGMGDPYHYRNKIQLPIGGTATSPQIGFFARGTHRIIDMDSCPLQDESTNAVFAAVRHVLTQTGTEPYREADGTGVLRHAVARSAAGQLMVTLVTATAELPQMQAWIDGLRAALPAMTSLWHNVQPRPTNVILGPTMHHLWGETHLRATLSGLEFLLSPASFFQVNPVQTEVLYRTALDYAAITPDDTVIDLYCGTGTISLQAARQAANVIGIELVVAAVRDATANATHNGITNAIFIAGDATKEMPRLAAAGIHPDVVILDPARTGATPSVLHAIATASPARIVYISCNPATLARDLALLTADGYRVTTVQPVDMFPHTAHVETVVLMSRVKD